MFDANSSSEGETPLIHRSSQPSRISRTTPQTPGSSGRSRRVPARFQTPGPSRLHAATAGPSRPAARQEEQRSRRKAMHPKRAIDRDIARLRMTWNLLIPKACFCRLVREILFSVSSDQMRMTPDSLTALQEASELYVTQFLEDSYMCTLHRQRVTLMPVDLQLVRALRSSNNNRAI